MERLFMISYDLRSSCDDFSELYSSIKKLGKYIHIMESTWLLKTSCRLDTDTIFKELRRHIMDTDSIMVVEITNANKQGWIPLVGWDFIKALSSKESS